MTNYYVQRARDLRSGSAGHVNCAQAVLAALAPACGIPEDTALALAAHFGGGMKMAATCGAITGALMAIGLLGGGDEAYRAFMTGMREHHDGMTDCADLLRANAKTGTPKKVHCDGMIDEAVALVVQVMGLEEP